MAVLTLPSNALGLGTAIVLSVSTILAPFFELSVPNWVTEFPVEAGYENLKRSIIESVSIPDLKLESLTNF